MTPEAEFVIERGELETGRTFSAVALDMTGLEFSRWVASAAADHWDRTGVPPTRAVIRAVVEFQ